MEDNKTLHLLTPLTALLPKNLTNSSVTLQQSFEIDLEDTNWILTNSFIIFTMQTGFGMLESGCVSVKNEANIMMKNLADISLGGLTYWIFGYGMSFGQGPLQNSFVGTGDFLVDPDVGDPLMGPVFASFLFQLSFATTATTIVSGAMAERTEFKAYCLFSFLNTVVYCVPAGWVWGEHGFLKKLGAVDIAGSGPVHLIGGSASLASALMLGPRLGRYAHGTAPLPLGNPVNAVMGTFVLWWGWLAFNSGSTYGVSGAKWQYAARAAVMTMMGSFGGGCFGLIFTLVRNQGRADVMELINSILGSLVSITAGCFLYRAWEALLIGVIGAAISSITAPLFDKLHIDDPVGASSVHGACGLWAGCFLYRAWEALLIGVIGAAISSITAPLFDKLHIDDPVGASSVHGACGLWGVLAVGLFADNPIPMDTTNGRAGLFKGGGWYLLGVQSLTVLCLATWGLVVTTVLLWLIDKVMPIRMEPYEELLGADLTEHRIRRGQVGVSRALSALRPFHRSGSIEMVGGIGVNTGHSLIIDKIYENQNQKKKPTSSKTIPGPGVFVNRAFEDPSLPERTTSFKYKGFLNKNRPENEHELNATVKCISGEIAQDGGQAKEDGVKIIDIKGKKLKQLSAAQLKELENMNVNEDRFRNRFGDEDYVDDIARSGMRWVD